MRPIYNKPVTPRPKSETSKSALRIQSLLQQAVDLHQKGAFKEAADLYEHVLSIERNNFEAIHLLGLIAYQTHNAQKGVEWMRRALNINPRSIACLVNLGLAEHATGDLGNATQRYLSALKIKRDFAQAHYNLANVYKDQKNWSAAILSYEAALSLKPDYWEAQLNLANVFESTNQFERALDSLNKVLFINPYIAKAYNNRGNVNKKLENWLDANKDYDVSIQLDQSYIDVYVNKGNLLKDLGYWGPANEAYSCCLKINPQHPKAIWNKSLLNLILGDFIQGWQGYEARWNPANAEELNLILNQLEGVKINREWRGGGEIKGKKLLLYAEQGLGDSIQFVRFVPQLMEMGAVVYLVVQSQLIELFKQIKGVSLLLAMGAQLPEYDLSCPLMSLPLVLKINTEEQFDRSPYIRSDPRKVEQWETRLAQIRPRPQFEHSEKRSSLRIGVAWRGNAVHANDKYRSLPYADFIECLPGEAHYISLQKDVSEAEKGLLLQDNILIDCTENLTDFSETAALCATLDLVICVDTSVAHLAAAMGKEVWVLLPFSPDWRWMINRKDSPWYGKVTLFRQTIWGDWSGVLKLVKQTLTQKMV